MKLPGKFVERLPVQGILFPREELSQGDHFAPGKPDAVKKMLLERVIRHRRDGLRHFSHHFAVDPDFFLGVVVETKPQVMTRSRLLCWPSHIDISLGSLAIFLKPGNGFQSECLRGLGFSS